MKAKKKPFDVKSPGDFGIDISQLNSSTQVRTLSYQYPAEKPQGKLFKGEDVEVMVDKVVKLLRDEAKVI